MHASLEDLLSYRDGAADESTRRHVEGCDGCRAEVARLSSMGEALRSLPVEAPPEDRWNDVQRRLHERRLGRRRAPLFAGLAAAASVVLAIALFAGLERPAEKSAPNPLVQRSQQLETELRAMEDRGVLSGAEARLIAGLEDRIALVDLQLASGEVGPAEAERLWQRRVDLLMDLRAVKANEVYVANTSDYVL